MTKRNMIILYVADQQRSAVFYQQILGTAPVLNVPGMTEFELPQSNMLLGLMPENGILKILENHTPSPAKGNGIPRCELYLFVEDTDAKFEKSLECGAKGISRGSIRTWGDYVAYVMDPDGNIIAFAKN